MNVHTQNDMSKHVSDDMNVSNKIRALDNAGYKRADIARFLDRRYQHVRNVLEKDAEKIKGKHSATRGKPDGPKRCKATISSEGRIVIPAEFREGMNVKAGETVSLMLDDGVLTVMSRSTGLRKAQELVRKYVPEGVDLVDELIKERRWEAAKEEKELREGYP